MAETKPFTKEDIASYAKGSTKDRGKVTLPSGTYRVSHLEKREEKIVNAKGESTARWIDVHVVGVGTNKFAGSFSGTRFATAGFDKTPTLGRVKNKWYYATKPINSIYQGDLADLLVEIQGKEIKITSILGQTPIFDLGSWETKAKAEEAAKAGFAEKQFLRIDEINLPVPVTAK